MSRLAISLILVFNSFALAACSRYETAAIPTNPDSEVPADLDAPVLKEGAQARVHLRSGEVHEGEITAVTDTHVTLGKPSNRGFAEISYAFADIEKCEVESSSAASSVLAGSVGVVMLVAVGTLIFFAIMWRDGGPGAQS